MKQQPGQPSAGIRFWRLIKRFFIYSLDEKKQLSDLLHRAERRNLIDAETAAMMEGALLVTEARARDIMTPRADMVFLIEGQSPREFMPIVIESGHSRFPLLDEHREKVVGILLVKDLLPLLLQPGGCDTTDLRDILRPPIFIPESKRLNLLLREFRNNRNHLAIVVDEYGSISGIVSIEDIIEQIVGEIGDEHDIASEQTIRRHRDNRYTVRGRTTIPEFNEYFGTTLSDEEYDTIGGMVVSAFGYLPVRGEDISLGDFNFKVLRADKRRVHLLRVLRLPPAPEPAQDDRETERNNEDTH
ncbi:MAG: CBS domain-containing protein [Gammaproteobacteria bacterium]|nr:CBS domain-containing protein [Gammaproteobacteria bacterium]